MFPLIWIPATLLAATFQVARNALQRGLLPQAGPWGATLVRFLFGLPFSMLFALTAWALSPHAHPDFSPRYFLTAGIGAGAQIAATASLLVAMRRAGFGVASAMQQSSLPLAAILGLVLFHDQLSRTSWIGVAVASVGLLALTWPKGATGPKPVSGGVYGVLAGFAFAISINAFRQAGIALEPGHRIFAAVLSVTVVQTMQTLGLGLVLALRDPASLRVVIASWRSSLTAGLCGSIASAFWNIAVVFAPAGPVRAVGVAEAPIAAIAGRRLFAERMSLFQLSAGAGVLAGVVMTALG